MKKPIAFALELKAVFLAALDFHFRGRGRHGPQFRDFPRPPAYRALARVRTHHESLELRMRTLRLATLLAATVVAGGTFTRAEQPSAFFPIEFPGSRAAMGFGGGPGGAVAGGPADAPQARSRRPEQFVRIDVPGAAFTVASGINGDGAIVGWYCLALPCNNLRARGFLLTESGFTHIDVPSSPDRQVVGTRARGVSPHGVVIGDYIALEGGVQRQRGYLWQAGEFSFIDPPAELYDNPAVGTVRHHVIPMRFGPNGEIIGCVHDRDMMASMYGVVFSGDNWTRFDMSHTMHNGVTPAGDVVGLDFMNGAGYKVDRYGNVETLTYPGADATEVWDINPRGETVGVWWRALGTTPASFAGRAFLRSAAGEYRTIHPAGATFSIAFGIAPNGNVVGSYADASGRHGFLLLRGD
jgi:hypothetical protein